MARPDSSTCFHRLFLVESLGTPTGLWRLLGLDGFDNCLGVARRAGFTEVVT